MALMHHPCPGASNGFGEFVRQEDGHLQCNTCGRNLVPLLDLPQVAMLPAAPDGELGKIADLAQRSLRVPFTLINLVDQEQQSRVGSGGDPEGGNTQELHDSLCQYVVMAHEPFVIPDVASEAILDHQFESDWIKAYAGAPITDINGEVVGAMCAIDDKLHPWTDEEVRMLVDFAELASTELQARGAAKLIKDAIDRRGYFTS